MPVRTFVLTGIHFFIEVITLFIRESTQKEDQL